MDNYTDKTLSVKVMSVKNLCLIFRGFAGG